MESMLVEGFSKDIKYVKFESYVIYVKIWNKFFSIRQENQIQLTFNLVQDLVDPWKTRSSATWNSKQYIKN